MNTRGRNEQLHVIEEFACQAILKTDVPMPHSKSRGVNSGVNVLTELQPQMESCSRDQTDVRKLSNAELAGYLKHLRTAQYSLEVQELFEIVAERLEHASD